MLIYLQFVRRITKEKSLQYQKDIQHQKDMLQQNIEVQESERERIAILLHDNVGNKLNILSVWLNSKDTWNNERSKEVVRQQIPDLIDATREISHTLYPVKLEHFGLILSIEEIIENIESSLKVKLILLREYTAKEISFELQIYRIIQEFITNVLKHSQANLLNLIIKDCKRYFCIILADNGVGFDTQSLKKGMGLRNIDQRIKTLNAVSKWKSKRGIGSRLIIIIPKT